MQENAKWNLVKARGRSVVITKMTKRPFGCLFSARNRAFAFSLNHRGQAQYKRLS